MILTTIGLVIFVIGLAIRIQRLERRLERRITRAEAHLGIWGEEPRALAQTDGKKCG